MAPKEPSKEKEPLPPRGCTYVRSRSRGFRSCYDSTVTFQPGLTLIVGENNSGKSNVIDAIRLATSPLSRRRTR